MEWINFGGQLRHSYIDVPTNSAAEAVRKAGLSLYLNEMGYIEYQDRVDRDERYLRACDIWLKFYRQSEDLERSKTFEGQGLMKVGTLLRLQDDIGVYLYLVGGELSGNEVEEGEFTRLRGDHIVLEYKCLDLT